MLKFFFNRSSKMVLLIEVVGLAGGCLLTLQTFAGRLSRIETILFAVVVVEYAFIRFCALWRWYPSGDDETGIRLQFKKAMVPTSYLLGLATWLSAAFHPLVIFPLTALLLAIIIHVNVILLFLHFKDHNPLPVNYFTKHDAPKEVLNQFRCPSI